MLDHLSLGVTDLARAMSFYDAAFAPLGYARQLANELEAAYGPNGAPNFWLYPVNAGESVVGAGAHVAIAAPDRRAVERAHAAALAVGGTSARAPGERPEISDSNSGAVVSIPRDTSWSSWPRAKPRLTSPARAARDPRPPP